MSSVLMALFLNNKQQQAPRSDPVTQSGVFTDSGENKTPKGTIVISKVFYFSLSKYFLYITLYRY